MAATPVGGSSASAISYKTPSVNPAREAFGQPNPLGFPARLIQVQYDKVRTLLTANKERIEAIARALLERETLDAEELKAPYEGREIAAHVHRVIIPTYSEKKKARAEKRKAASIFGGPPKPATS